MIEQWLPMKKVPAVLRWTGTMLIVILGFVVFRADTLQQGLQIIQTMFTGWGSTNAQTTVLHQVWTPALAVAVLLSVVFSMPIVPVLKNWHNHWLYKGSFAMSVVLLILVMLNLAGGSYNPFIYFRF